jgi:hypothetical protein
MGVICPSRLCISRFHLTLALGILDAVDGRATIAKLGVAALGWDLVRLTAPILQLLARLILRACAVEGAPEEFGLLSRLQRRFGGQPVAPLSTICNEDCSFLVVHQLGGECRFRPQCRVFRGAWAVESTTTLQKLRFHGAGRFGIGGFGHGIGSVLDELHFIDTIRSGDLNRFSLSSASITSNV